MASKLASRLGFAAFALVTGVSALGHRYEVSDEYNASNFFSKFDFFVSNYSTGNYNDVDPTSGTHMSDPIIETPAPVLVSNRR